MNRIDFNRKKAGSTYAWENIRQKNMMGEGGT